MSIKQPTGSNTDFPEITEPQQFTSLTSIIRDESAEPVTEASVVDTDAPETETKEPKGGSEDEILPTPEAEKYAPLGSDKKVQEEVKDGVIEAPETAEDKDDSPEQPDTKGGPVSPEDTFNFFKEAGLLHIPKDFTFDGTEETFQKLVEYDQQAREYYAAERLKNSIKDPKVFDLINHGMQGGAFADVAKMFELTQEQLNLESLDITKESDAEKLVRKYYKEVAKFPEAQTERFIRSAKSEETLENDAQVALKYYKEHTEAEKVRLNTEAAEKKRAAEVEFSQKIAGITAAVKEANYQGEVLNGISSLVSPVVDSTNKQVFKEDGQPMLWYEVVVDQVSQNGKHLTDLLAFLQGYDVEKGFAKIAEQKKTTEQTKEAKSAFEMFNKIGKKGKGGANDITDGQVWVPTPPNSYDE